MAPKRLNILIFDDDELEKDETFTVVLSDAEGGCVFDKDTDGGRHECICTVTIVNDDERATRFAKALQVGRRQPALSPPMPRTNVRPPRPRRRPSRSETA